MKNRLKILSSLSILLASTSLMLTACRPVNLKFGFPGPLRATQNEIEEIKKLIDEKNIENLFEYISLIWKKNGENWNYYKDYLNYKYTNLLGEDISYNRPCSDYITAYRISFNIALDSEERKVITLVPNSSRTKYK